MDHKIERTLHILVLLISQNLKALQNIGGFFYCLNVWGLSQRLRAGSGTGAGSGIGSVSSAGSGSDTGSGAGLLVSGHAPATL
jgi:hypothetical protein